METENLDLPYQRHCTRCGRDFTCNGRCEDHKKLTNPNYNEYCYCYKCAKRTHINTRRNVVSQKLYLLELCFKPREDKWRQMIQDGST